MFSTHTTKVVNGGRQIWMDLNHAHTKSLIKPPKIEGALMLSFSLARRICLLKNYVNFWNRLTFLNKHSNTL